MRRCLAQWETERPLNEFPLGERDTPNRLLRTGKIVRTSSGDRYDCFPAFERVVRGWQAAVDAGCRIFPASANPLS